MLTVNSVSKHFGSHAVLEDVQLEFSNGVYGLLAPNGAGKTTLIKMLTTLLHPGKGEILYSGQNILSMGETYRELIGYLPQDFGYYKNYTPYQYLQYLAALKGISKKEADEKIPHLMKLVALEGAVKKKMGKFSGGMIQRVGIAQAMLNDPKILILDEPTAGLDPKERVRFRNLLSDLARDRIVILSTHIVSDVESIANEIIMIKDAKVLYKDSIANICRWLDGKVFETEIEFSEAADFRRNFLSLSERQEQGRMNIRFMAEERQSAHWKQVQPVLEDIFLYEYRDEAGITAQ
ncbi:MULTISPECIES: ABC transporter ATP-binding protein [Bacillus]|uniref:ABC transporter ATP-binding protein n=1 Tax=Bacillus TaxID=1386 RepID=UPI00101B6FF1|nr:MULTISPECIES: ABC transporter ATP-binding protein [Bacillus]MCA1037282.1 ABC transporter ATP-binding protein [Bacillus infantis]MDT0161011.1 ABC transporter ATP-binding protein [Bacillus sp. AG4(2022)]RYI26527.1 ABC transporter ATP-binding protein [Bacillus infantis]